MSNPLVAVLADLERPANELEAWMQATDFDFWIDVQLMLGPPL